MRGVVLAVLLAAGPAAAESLNPLSALTPDALPAMSGRPLFSATRRPPAVMEEEPDYDFAAHEPTPLPEATLIGVVAAGGRSFALVDEGGTTRRLEVGATLGEWTVHSIGAERMVIGDGEREETLRLFASTQNPVGEDEASDPGRSGADGESPDLATATGEDLLDMIRRRAR